MIELVCNIYIQYKNYRYSQWDESYYNNVERKIPALIATKKRMQRVM